MCLISVGFCVELEIDQPGIMNLGLSGGRPRYSGGSGGYGVGGPAQRKKLGGLTSAAIGFHRAIQALSQGRSQAYSRVPLVPGTPAAPAPNEKANLILNLTLPLKIETN